MSKIESKSGWLIGGGVLAAIISSLCCIGPLVLTLMGVSGAAALGQFEALRLPMIIIVVIVFGIAGVLLIKKRSTCEPGSICANPSRYRLMLFVYALGLVISLLAITSPQWLVYLF